MKAIVALVVGLLIGCNKPSEEDCKKAIVNMSVLMGTETQADADINGEVRRCRGGSKKEAVACAIAAKSTDELHACGFSLKAKSPKKTDGGSGSGSATK